MIQVLVGDLLDSDAQTLVNTVNCVGIMGKGIALEFKRRFPEMYQDYAERCARKEVRLGEPYLYRGLFPPYIINFPTKDHWRSVSKLPDIVAGLDHLERHYREWGITSLAVPPLGCGQGQLEWSVVGPTLFRHLSKLNIPVELYAPLGTPQAELEEAFLGQIEGMPVLADASTETPKIDPAWVALVAIVARIEQEFYHWPVGRTRFQKLAYFATEGGLPTGLHFKRGSYGPFASDLKPLITKLVNNGLLREENHGRMFIVKPGPTYADAVRASVYQKPLAQWAPMIDRIADLLLRIPTTDTEIVATVHCAWSSMSQDAQGKVSETQVFEEVKRWKHKRNPPLDETIVIQTIRNLDVLGWLDVDPDSDSLLPKSDTVQEDDLALETAPLP